MSWKDRILNMLPEYVADKASGADFKQYELIPDHLRHKIINGDDTEAGNAINELRGYFRQRNSTLFEATEELLSDMRGIVQESRNKQVTNFFCLQ